MKATTIKDGKRLVAIVASETSKRDIKTVMRRFTAFVKFSEEVEEIDVDAVNSMYARDCAEKELKRHYMPGGKIIKIEERFGLYF